MARTPCHYSDKTSRNLAELAKYIYIYVYVHTYTYTIYLYYTNIKCHCTRARTFFTLAVPGTHAPSLTPPKNLNPPDPQRNLTEPAL